MMTIKRVLYRGQWVELCKVEQGELKEDMAAYHWWKFPQWGEKETIIDFDRIVNNSTMSTDPRYCYIKAGGSYFVAIPSRENEWGIVSA